MTDAQPTVDQKPLGDINPTTEGRFDSWLTPGRFAAILSILILSCFPQVVAGFETFYYRDFSCFGYPLAFHHREAFWRFEMPLWNPFNESGMPFTAQWNTLTLYPLSIFYLLFPLSWSLGVFCLGHLFLAGMGMYFLAHRWTGNRFAASVAGVIFAFNGLTWHSLMWPNNIAALGWMPWVVWLVERCWCEGGRSILLAALAGAMQMLSGAPEIIAQTWGLLALLWVVQFILGEIPRGRMILRAAIAVVLISGLAAAQLLPFLDLLSHSQRDQGFGDSQWAMPVSGLINYVVPLFRAETQSGGYEQHAQYWTGSYFLGVGTVLLAILGVWHARNGFTRMLTVLVFISLLMALGDNGILLPAVKHVFPQIGFMRFPIKFVVTATFAIPLLAAAGLNWVQSGGNWDKVWKHLRVVGAMLVALIVITLWYAAKHQVDYENINVTITNGLGRGFFLFLILGCLFMLQKQKEIKFQRILQITLLIILWMDVFTHRPTLNPSITRVVFEPDMIRNNMNWDGQLRPGVSRAMLSLEGMRLLHGHRVTNAVSDIDGRRLGLFDDLNLLDHAAKFDGFFSLEIKEYKEIVSRAYLATNDFPKLKDFLGISHYSSTNGVDWITRTSYLPMITAGQKPVFVDGTNALNALFERGFDPAGVVYLPTEAQGRIQAREKSEVAVKSARVSAQSVSAEVDAKSPAMVVVAQTFYHPWRAFVDGKPSQLWRANYAFQAVEIPSGNHQIQLVYEDQPFKAGAIISVIALIFCLAGIFVTSRKSAISNV